MKKKKLIVLSVVALLFIIGVILLVLIPRSEESQLAAVCRVEARACYAVAVDKSDTLYISLRDDSLQTATVEADSLPVVADQSGTFVSNAGNIVTSDALIGCAADTLTAKQLNVRLTQLDSLLTQNVKRMRGEVEELDDYAKTHTVVDDGYNEVMIYRERVTQRVHLADSALHLVKRALQRPALTASLHTNIKVLTPYSKDTLSASISQHQNHLLLLQLHSLCLPKGCSRFSVYRFGTFAKKSQLLAFNDLGGQTLSYWPTKSAAATFSASEGGAWVNAFGHICSIQHNGKAVNSKHLAQLLRAEHAWPVWWITNIKDWIEQISKSSSEQSMIKPHTGLSCVSMPINDSITYVGQVDTHRRNGKQYIREGFGQLLYKSGAKYEGRWLNDSLKCGKYADRTAIYSGQFGNNLQFEGQGVQLTAKGERYQGEWKGGKRSGHGFSVQSHRMVRCGSWKNNRFQGERMVYTADRVYGIDISRHQHEKGRKRYGIDWGQLRITSLGSGRRVQGTVNYPVSYVYIKATEGRTLRNKYYINDLRQARKHGIATGSYHFFTATSSGLQQAKHFLKVSSIIGSDLPPVLDLEPTSKQIAQMGGDAAMFRQVLVWLHAVERHCGKRPILYVGQLFVNNHLKNAPSELRNYKVWIARYGEFKPYVKLLHWQLTPYGRVRGIHGEVDINVFNGSKEAFRKLTGKAV